MDVANAAPSIPASNTRACSSRFPNGAILRNNATYSTHSFAGDSGFGISCMRCSVPRCDIVAGLRDVCNSTSLLRLKVFRIEYVHDIYDAPA